MSLVVVVAVLVVAPTAAEMETCWIDGIVGVAAKAVVDSLVDKTADKVAVDRVDLDNSVAVG